jgi:3-oxoacyl-[acyl-carrier-protein] synthase II
LAGIRGENLTVSTACASSLQAIGEAFRRVKDGYLNSALAGGGDSRLSAGGILAYRKARAVYAGDNDSDAASRPFDADRAGFVPGEGGGFFLLEESAQARKRGARIYAEVCGYGSSLDGAGLTAPASDGREAKAAVLNALAEAQITPTAIEMISAHGTGTPLNDKREADMIDELFGERRPPVTALKSWIGHAATGCGAVELSLLLYCMKEQYLPEIRNLREPCHQRVHFVRESGPFSFGAFLIENFGFGGQNAALVIRQAE